MKTDPWLDDLVREFAKRICVDLGIDYRESRAYDQIKRQLAEFAERLDKDLK